MSTHTSVPKLYKSPRCVEFVGMLVNMLAMHSRHKPLAEARQSLMYTSHKVMSLHNKVLYRAVFITVFWNKSWETQRNAELVCHVRGHHS